MSGLIGQSFGRYHILEQLGEGGMATVFKAYDTRLEREVALKVIRKDVFPPSQLDNILARFEREAKSLARLSHPNIVPIIDYGEQDGIPYLVMVYLPGGTLKQKLGSPMPWREAARLLTPIAEALEYAHEENLIHRDVKPSNILLTQKGQSMLTDFGIAKILEGGEGQTLTATGVGIGTPEYMAPEQWIGNTSVQSDIYSLGVVLFELVTGRKPYVADTPAAVLLKQANESLPHPTEFIPDLPDEVSNVIIKALAKYPEYRYENMGAFARALEKLSQVSPTEPTLVSGAGTQPESPIGEKTLIGGTTEPGSGKKPETPQPKQQGTEPTLVQQVAPAAKATHWYWWLAGAVVVIIALAGGIWLLGSLLNGGTPTAASTNLPPTRTLLVATKSPVILPTQTSSVVSPTQTALATTAECARLEVFCVGLVTDIGEVDDKSFNQTAWEGIKKAQTDGVANIVDYIETTSPDDYEKNIATFGDAGYDVIVTIGFNLTEPTYAMAQKFPDTKFIGIDQNLSKDDMHPNWPLPNLVSISYNEDKSGFLVGALAAMMSKNHVIGAVCGTDAIPAVWRYGEGYRAGAAYADVRMGTKTDVIVVYHNDASFEKTFADPIWGARTANELIDKGADVVFGCGGKTGNGAILAAAQRKVYVIGVDTDQYYTLPEAANFMLSSALKPETEPLAVLIKLTRDNRFPVGGIFYGPAGFAPYHDLTSQVPVKVDDEMQKLQSGLMDGSIKTNVPPAKTAQ